MSDGDRHGSVYLVDDEAAVRRSVGFMLHTAGFAVESL